MPQVFELEPKKWPKQQRSQATFNALIDACTLVLPKLGYAGTSTNHIADAAGVGIASLYEYFPGKDAIIALVIKNLSDRVFTQLGKRAISLKDLPPQQFMEAWLNEIYACLLEEQNIIRVISLEVPFSQHIFQTEDLAQQILQFSEALEQQSLDFLPKKQSKASMFLIVNLVVGSMTQLLIEPPKDISAEELITELSLKLNQWIFNV
jgi:AcrR family transcriptional regulator